MRTKPVARSRIHRRKPLRRISPKHAKEMRLYRAARLAYLEDHPKCHVCYQEFREGGKRYFDVRPATEIHHKKGRGKLLLAQEFWIGTCAECHTHIHRNPKLAMKAGLLLPRLWKT